MEIEGVIQWILNNPNKYPGLHQSPQARSDDSYKPLVPASQLQLIWKATVEYLQEFLSAGKGVNIRGFGAFTFAIETEHPKIARIDPTSNIEEQREERKHVHKVIPVFAPDPTFEYVLSRYHRKNFLDKPQSQHSVFQKGFQMMFCNPAPIAQACFLQPDVVKSAHSSLFNAIKDLTRTGRHLLLKFNFAVLIVKDRALDVQFSPSFKTSVRDKTFEKKMRKSDARCTEFWMTSHEDKWRKSALSSLWTRPSAQKVLEMNEKTLALKVMSLDLSTSVKARNN